MELPSLSKIEYFFSKFLYKFPKIRKMIIFLYLRLFSIINFKKRSLSHKYKIQQVGPQNDNSFFGYFDYSPSNHNGLILCHHTKLSTSSLPKNNRPIFISVFDSNNIKVPIITTYSFSYNWQQGSRLKWLNNLRFIYNDFDFKNKKYISYLFCLKEKKIISKFNYPNYAVHKDKFFLSLKTERLSLLQEEYGYFNKPPMKLSESMILNRDGVTYLDLESGNAKILFSLEDCLQLISRKIPINSDHVINHLLISQDGNKFVFLYRIFINKKRIDFLIEYDLILEKLKLIINSCLISHYCWIDNIYLLVFMYKDNKKGSYYKVNIQNGKITNIFSDDKLNISDGHPSMISSFKFITDTYPDRNRIQKLLLIDIDKKKIENILDFSSDLKFSGISRCDMHPRYDNHNKKIFFDTGNNCKRKLNFIDFK